MEQLKKCPFCGGEATFSDAIDDVAARIRCTKCGCEIHMKGRPALRKAWEAWNTRKPLERIAERLEACQEMAYEVKNQINDIYMERRICKEEYCKGRIHAYQRAIEIVKEEGLN